MFRVYRCGSDLRPADWTVTSDPAAALAAFRTLLERNDSAGAAVLSRDGRAVHMSRYDMPLGAGRLAPGEHLAL